MSRWDLCGAQQAVNVVAAVMVGRPYDEVAAELDTWLDRFGADLAPSVCADVAQAIARGSAMVVLEQPRRDAQPVSSR